MPIPQIVSPNHGEIPETAQGVRLLLKVNPNRDKFTNQTNGTLYHLKEVSLLYEKETVPRSNLNMSYEDSFRRVNQTNQDLNFLSNRLEEAKQKNMHHLKASLEPNQGIFPSKPTYQQQQRLNTKQLKVLPQNPSVENQSSSAVSRSPSQWNDLNKEELLQQYQALVLEKYHCRENLDKSIDEFTRKNLESKYFAATEALFMCEDKLRNTRYGKYLSKFKQKILRDSRFKSQAQPRDQQCQSVLLNKDPKKRSRLNGKQTDPKATLELLQSHHEEISFQRDIISPENVRLINDDSKQFPVTAFERYSSHNNYPNIDHRFSYSSSNTSVLPNSEHKDIVIPRGSQTQVQDHSLLLKNRLGETNISHNGFRRGGIKDENTWRRRSESLNPTRSFKNSDDIVSQAMELRGKYQKLMKIRLLTRKRLENEINDEELRERIEAEYFKAQLKLETIRLKLKQLADEAGMDWRQLFAIINVEENDNESDQSSNSTSSSNFMDQSRHSSKNTHQTMRKKESINDDEIYDVVRHSKGFSPGRGLADSFERSRLAHRIDSPKSISDYGSKTECHVLNGTNHNKIPSLQNKGVQTESFDYNNNSDVIDQGNEQGRYSNEVKPNSIEKTKLNQNQVSSNVPTNFSQVSAIIANFFKSK